MNHFAPLFDICVVCESPTVTSAHFGARTCKACAAFFRRTVALHVKYSCYENNRCVVHFEKRMICKKCRMDKCIKMAMNPDLVQSKAGEKNYWNAASISPTMSISQSFRIDAADVITNYVEMESNLNDGRRILYTSVKIKDILGNRCECPYKSDVICPSDPRNGVACSKGDFILLLEYSRAFTNYESLNVDEQNIFYRHCWATDKIMNEAFYTVRIGLSEERYILLNGAYIRMNPLPPTAERLIENGYFNRNEKQAIDFYRAVVPFKVDLWFEIVKPMEKINLNFEEFALLKALVCWHISYYKFSESGRHICEIERNRIMEAILHLNRADNIGAAERLGELVLFMSCIFEQVYKLVNSMTVITMFELCKFDPLLSDLLDHNANSK